MTIADPRDAAVFRFVRREFADAELRLVYAFDDGPELVERLVFPDARLPPPERAAAFEAALDLLHAIAGISYYKAGVPPDLKFDTRAPSAPMAGSASKLRRIFQVCFAVGSSRSRSRPNPGRSSTCPSGIVTWERRASCHSAS